MSYQLHFRRPRSEQHSNTFFLALGKAVYVAAAFERKCAFALEIAQLKRHVEATGDLTASMQLLEQLDKIRLGTAIQSLRAVAPCTEADIRCLNEARIARNSIVHSMSADLPPVAEISAASIIEQSRALRDTVATLAEGDSLVSRWVYWIEEKESPDPFLARAYCEALVAWVIDGGPAAVREPTLDDYAHPSRNAPERPES